MTRSFLFALIIIHIVNSVDYGKLLERNEDGHVLRTVDKAYKLLCPWPAGGDDKNRKEMATRTSLVPPRWKFNVNKCKGKTFEHLITTYFLDGAAGAWLWDEKYIDYSYQIITEDAGCSITNKATKKGYNAAKKAGDTENWIKYMIYHESQRLGRCVLHAFNDIFQQHVLGVDGFKKVAAAHQLVEPFQEWATFDKDLWGCSRDVWLAAFNEHGYVAEQISNLYFLNYLEQIVNTDTGQWRPQENTFQMDSSNPQKYPFMVEALKSTTSLESTTLGFYTSSTTEYLKYTVGHTVAYKFIAGSWWNLDSMPLFSAEPKRISFKDMIKEFNDKVTEKKGSVYIIFKHSWFVEDGKVKTWKIFKCQTCINKKKEKEPNNDIPYLYDCAKDSPNMLQLPGLTDKELDLHFYRNRWTYGEDPTFYVPKEKAKQKQKQKQNIISYYHGDIGYDEYNYHKFNNLAMILSIEVVTTLLIAFCFCAFIFGVIVVYYITKNQSK